MELFPQNTKIDFMGHKHYAFAFSALIFLLSAIAFFSKKG